MLFKNATKQIFKYILINFKSESAMNETQKQTIQALAEAEIRHSFNFIKEQTDKDGKDLVAYYFFLVDDFLLPIMQALPAKTSRRGKNRTITTLSMADY